MRNGAASSAPLLITIIPRFRSSREIMLNHIVIIAWSYVASVPKTMRINDGTLTSIDLTTITCAYFAKVAQSNVALTSLYSVQLPHFDQPHSVQLLHFDQPHSVQLLHFVIVTTDPFNCCTFLYFRFGRIIFETYLACTSIIFIRT